MSRAEEIRAACDVAALHGLWDKAREVRESPDRPATFRLELPDDAARAAVGDVYGRPMWGQGTRISVSKLDDAVRARFGVGLDEVLAIVHGRPVAAGTSAAPERGADPLRSALAERGLAGAPWAGAWVRWVHQYGRVAEAELPEVARAAAEILSALALDGPPADWVPRAELAARAGDAHLLDAGTTLSRLVLKAAALAHDVEAPANERARAALWERCGVAGDAVSATALCWALPLVGDDPWSRGVAGRTALGLPVHLSLLDLRAAPERLVTTGTPVAVCENPRVLEAAVAEGVRHPLIAATSHPSAAVHALLRRLTADGAVLHCHADFDWSGIALADSLTTAHGARPWRMSSEDYRDALDRAAAARTDLPPLVGTPAATPWDPDLTTVMATNARALPEETHLSALLADLRGDG
ncbi:TIGR02679 family protein [Saccharopolyspora rosea]|uniref:TIGR02679 family protein n=1 Tax=Saccharopolyspora rosea TaxID=524884 RepID=UPI0021DB36E8|nr:TIGR02679 family protein [Saccharopolyspora rosea]